MTIWTRVWCVAVAVLLLLCVSAPASAQGGTGGLGGQYRGHVTAHIGSTAGGDAPNSILTFGGAVSVQDENGWGSELDFGYAHNSNDQLQDADLGSVMINASWVKPRGPMRPYAVFGVGALGVHGCLLPCSVPTTTWNFGLDGGGGVRYDLNDIIAIGGDARYFIAPGSHDGTSRPSNFGFWRVAVGLTVSWLQQ